jgi:formate dehydrogenase accessory protein FdhD
VHLQTSAEREMALRQQRRTLTGRTGCGLCGKESLAQAIGPCRTVSADLRLTASAIERAASGLMQRQAIFARTGAVHAAAWCAADGGIRLVREDVGRHNALDKLIGALAAGSFQPARGFVLMTSRASYEIVHKAAAVGIELVAAISAPTGLAIRMAEAAGQSLVGFVRDGRCTVYSHPSRLRRMH